MVGIDWVDAQLVGYHRYPLTSVLYLSVVRHVHEGILISHENAIAKPTLITRALVTFCLNKAKNNKEVLETLQVHMHKIILILYCIL